MRDLFPSSKFFLPLAFAVGIGSSVEDARAEPTREALESQYRDQIEPILIDYCYDCHGDGEHKGELALDDFEDIDGMIADRPVWERIRDHIDFRLMPPPDEYAPDDDERKALVDWIDAAVFPVDPANPDPGHVTMRRLNRTEYKNTIRDLLGVEIEVSGLLPPDDSGYGFDNIGDVLTTSPAHLERYLDAAKLAVDAAVHLGPMPRPARKILGRELNGNGQQSGDGHYFSTNGEVGGHLEMANGKRYRIEVMMEGSAAGDQWPHVRMLSGEREIAEWTVETESRNAQAFSVELSADEQLDRNFKLVFDNDRYLPDEPREDRRDCNLMVAEVRVIGPLDDPLPPKPETHRRIFGEQREIEDDGAYMTEVLERFAARAFRQPVARERIERYLIFLEQAQRDGESVDFAIYQALQAILVSPSFLFREERTDADALVNAPTGAVAIDEFALASRLSYFLWSSMPDDELLRVAGEGKLRAQLGEQVRRMLASPRQEEFVRNFVGQWLQLRDMESVEPNRRIFRDFDRSLAHDMRTETEMLFGDLLSRNEPAVRLLDADFTFLNQRLAKHYEVQGPEGETFERVSLEGSGRRGLLNQGSILTLTSYPNRTSPVLRGKFVLENILDQPPPPPPPDVPQLVAPGSHGEGLSMRAQLEKHRESSACASCHVLMDPIGFGLDQYDAVGRWREFENGVKIDPSGELMTGQSFTDSEGLRNIIATDLSGLFERALTKKMLTYALGRGVEWYDKPAIDGILEESAKTGTRLQDLVLAVANSVPFQYRRDAE